MIRKFVSLFSLTSVLFIQVVSSSDTPPCEFQTVRMIDPGSFLMSDHCRSLLRRLYLNRRGLPITEEETKYLKIKDRIAKLRDEIRTEIIYSAEEILSGESEGIIDPLKLPQTMSLMRRYEKLFDRLKKEKERLETLFKSDKQRRLAYIAQDFITQASHDAFMSNLYLLRSQIIGTYQEENDPEVAKMLDGLQPETPERNAKIVAEIMEKIINDKRNPLEHVDHLLNNGEILYNLEYVFHDAPLADDFARKNFGIIDKLKLKKYLKFKSEEEEDEAIKKFVTQIEPLRFNYFQSLNAMSVMVKNRNNESFPELREALKKEDKKRIHRLAMAIEGEATDPDFKRQMLPEGQKSRREKISLESFYGYDRYSEEELEVLQYLFYNNKTNSDEPNGELLADGKEFRYFKDWEKHI